MFNNTSLRLLSKLGLTYCALQLALRIFLFFLSAQDVSWQLRDILRTISLGFAYDIVVALCLLAPLALLLFFISGKLKTSTWRQKLIQLGILCFFSTLIFTTVCEYYFWQEFHTRFNFIAVDYLVYTNELLKNIWQSYPVIPLLIGVILLSLVLTFAFCKVVSVAVEPLAWRQRAKHLAVYSLALLATLVGMRATFTDFAATNRYNQEIAGNGTFQLFHAFFFNELDYDRFYLHENNSQVLARLQAKLALDGSTLNTTQSINRREKGQGSLTATKPNIVVICVESLSAKFTGLVDKGHSLTPYLDALAAKSYTFDRVYATGTRTVRGLEAVSLSLPPTPGQSIIRRPDCHDLFNIATPLKQLGYTTQFVYGGYGYFDNMNDFFSGNGFDIVDRTDIPKEEVTFETVWGVADEILFNNALKQLDAQTPKQPVMQLIMTTTNHRPYTFPKDSINAPQGKRSSVVEYTDYAIHKFLQTASTKPWFDNTVFVILADHNADVAGKTGLPISKYHIPALVYAPKLIQPGVNNRLMSQIDVLPTVYGMLGMNYQSQDMGYDVNKLPLGQERAFVSTYQEMGYIAQDTLVILEPNSKVKAFHINDYSTNDYTPITPSQELVEDAITWYQGASYLYKNKLLKMNFAQANWSNDKKAL